MKRLIILTLILSSSCYATQEEQAMRAITRALLKTETGRTLRKTAEKTVLNTVGLNKKDLIYFIPLIPVIQGRISTNRIKGMSLGGDEFHLRPNASYDMRSGVIRGTMDFSIDF